MNTKPKLNSIIQGIIALILMVIALVPSSYAIATNIVEQSIVVSLNKISIEVNGDPVEADNILYEGRTYVQLRSISEMLSKDVIWDEETSVAGINDKDVVVTEPDTTTMSDTERHEGVIAPMVTVAPIPTPLPIIAKGNSRRNPANVSEIVNITFDNKWSEQDEKNADISVTEIIRGEQAYNMMLEWNQFNSPPEEGYEFILAKVKFNLLSSKDRLSLRKFDFEAISNEGRDYPMVSGVIDDVKSISTDIYSGASHEGYALLQVLKSDDKPLLTFGRDYKGNGGAWIKLYD